MSLRWYRRPRLVVLKPNSSVLDAARVIEQSRIGTAVIQDRGRVVGIVTDRDLVVRALGRARDAQTTKIAEVMTTSPAALTPGDSVADAVRLMQERNVRRIPLIEGERVVGMVTLDDLLLDESAPLEELAAIVQSQIVEAGATPGPRSPVRRRGRVRANAAVARLFGEVRAETGLEDLAQSRTALAIVLASLVRRLTPEEAGNLIAQLPSPLQPALRTLPSGPDKSIDEMSIVAELATRLDLDREDAHWVLVTVAGIVAGSISEDQAENVRSQLPDGLRDLFRASRNIMFVEPRVALS